MNQSKTTLSAGITVALIAGFFLFSAWTPSIEIHDSAGSDTTKKSGKKKEAKYSRKSVMVYNEDGVPHEELTESYEGDESLRKIFDGSVNEFEMSSFPHDMENFKMPAFPNMEDFEVPEFPEMSGFVMPPFPEDQFHFDSLQMKEFFNLSQKFDGFDEKFNLDMERMQLDLEKMNLNLEENLNGFDEHLKLNLDGLDERINEGMLKGFKGMEESLGRLKFDMDVWQESWNSFQAEAQKELIKDGYLKEGEKIEDMSFNHDELKFNGKAIKQEHQDKYKGLRDKYLNRNPFRGRPE